MLEDMKLHVKLKLAALWTSLMFLWIYVDYFGLYVPGTLQHMIDGRFGPLGPTTQGLLLVVATLTTIPGLLISLSLLLPATASRWMNLFFGVFYAIIEALTIPGAWAFYIALSLVEIAICGLIVWFAWSWPKSSSEHLPAAPDS